MEKGIVKKAISNVKFIVLSSIIITLFQLFVVGYNIKVLGESLAGFFFLIQTITGLGGNVINFGFGSAAIKDISSNICNNRKDKIQDIIGTLWIFNSVLAFVVFIIIFLLRYDITIWAKLDNENFSVAAKSLVFFAISFFIQISFSIYEIIPSAYQQYKYQSYYSTINAIMGSIGNFLILTFIPSILYVAYYQVFLSILSVFLILLFSKKITGIFFKPIFNKYVLKEQFSFSLKVFLTTQSYNFRDSVDRWSLNTLLGSSSLPGFILGQRIYLRINSFFISIIHILFPMVSELNANEDNIKVYKIYSLAESVISITGIIFFTLIIFLASDLLKIWISVDFSIKYYLIFQISLIQGAVAMLYMVPFFITLGMNKPNMNLVNALIQLFIIIFSAFVIIPYYGVTGAALSQLFAFLIIIFPQNYFLKKYFYSKKLIDVISPQLSAFVNLLIMTIGLVLFNFLELEKCKIIVRILYLIIFILFQLLTVYVMEFKLLKYSGRLESLKIVFHNSSKFLKVLKMLNISI